MSAPSHDRTGLVPSCYLCNAETDDGVPFPDVDVDVDDLDAIRQHIFDHIEEEDDECPYCDDPDDLFDFKESNRRDRVIHYLKKHQGAPIVECASCEMKFLFSWEF